GRAITFVEPRQARELEAIEKHIGTSIGPWSPGAKTKPAPVVEGPKRHDKPQIKRSEDGPWRKLLVSAGRADGLAPADLVQAVTVAAGIDGEAVRDVRVLERFSMLAVPEAELQTVLERVDGARAGDAVLRVETVDA